MWSFLQKLVSVLCLERVSSRFIGLVFRQCPIVSVIFKAFLSATADLWKELRLFAMIGEIGAPLDTSRIYTH